MAACSGAALGAKWECWYALTLAAQAGSGVRVAEEVGEAPRWLVFFWRNLSIETIDHPSRPIMRLLEVYQDARFSRRTPAN
jgi:hypothetical protein